MTRDEFLAYLKATHEKMLQVVEQKNHDYCGDANPFGNFMACEALGIAEAEKGILVRLVDKFKRIITFVNTGVLKVADEKVEDTCIDAANYFLILAALIHSKKMKQIKKAPASEEIEIQLHPNRSIWATKQNGSWYAELRGITSYWASITDMMVDILKLYPKAFMVDKNVVENELGIRAPGPA